MVTHRTSNYTFTWNAMTKTADGYPVEGAASTLTLLCRPEPANPNLKIGVPGGNFTDVRFKLFTDPFTDTLPDGAEVTVNGIALRVVYVHQYQKNAEIWLG